MDGCGDDLEAAELVAGHESSYFTKIICKKNWRSPVLLFYEDNLQKKLEVPFQGLEKNRLDGIAQHFQLVIIFFNRFSYLARGFFLLSGQMTIDSGSFAHFANVTERNIMLKYT